MKSFKNVNMGIQGDIAIMRVASLPDNLVKVEAEDGRLIVAHSETGHHHTVPSNVAELYDDPSDSFSRYLVINGEAKLEHQRPYDTHETVTLDNGIFRINRQREHTPEGLRAVQD